jgi:phosphatidylglycerol lysyltransferase
MQKTTQHSRYIVWTIAGLAAIGGLILIFQATLIGYRSTYYLYTLLPLGIYRANRVVRLVVGFTILFFSANLLRRRRVAWLVVLAGSILAMALHLAYVRTWYAMVLPLLTIATLLVYRDEFQVESESDSLKTGLLLALAVVVGSITIAALAYFFLDVRQFGREISLGESFTIATKQLFLLGNPGLVPRTRYAHFFIDLIDVLGILALGGVLYSLFRPLQARLARPHELELATEIIHNQADNPFEYFKLWPPKALFFNAQHSALIAYGVRGNIALAFKPPVGPADQIAGLVGAYDRHCRQQGWLPAYLNVGGAHLQMFKDLDYRTAKAGECAVVNLAHFVSHTRQQKPFSYLGRRFERDGIRLKVYEAQQGSQFYRDLRQVSDAWLGLPNRHEQGFSLGYFNVAYLTQCRIFTLEAAEGQILAFANQLPSAGTEEATIDLMRYRPDAPNSSMDELFAQIFEWLHEHGYSRFNLGLAPLAGVSEMTNKTSEEWVMGQMYENISSVFSYKGLRQYKNKFEPVWEPEYIVYRGVVTDMLRIARAYTRLSKVHTLR